MDTLMLILALVGIGVSLCGVWFSWKAKKEATKAKTAAEAASREIKIKKNIESISEVISVLDKAISILNKRLSGNIDRGADINTENQLLRDCTAMVSRNEERIKDDESKLKVHNLREKAEREIPKYKDGTELNKTAEAIVSCLKDMQRIFAKENENAIY